MTDQVDAQSAAQHAPMEFEGSELDFWQDPHTALRVAREHHPLAWLRGFSAWLVLRYGDVEALLGDRRLTSDYGGLADGALGRVFSGFLANQQGATHARLRRLVITAFTPRRIEEARPAIRDITQRLLRSLPYGEVVDFQRTVADELTVHVICRILGIPDEDISQFSAWTTQLTSGSASPVPSDEAQQAAANLHEYIGALAARCRSAPRNSLLDALIAAEADGQRLTSNELANVVMSLLIGGHDSVRSFLTIATWVVLRHPDVFDRLRADASGVGDVVEEVLRFESPLMGVPRVATEALRIGDVEISAGSRVLLQIISANRDPRRFLDPDRFDPSRDASAQLAFGRGMHFCVGAALARIEAQELLLELASRNPPLTLVDAPRWVPFSPSRRLEALSVRTR
ncbi:MAG: cytochrome P450 [Deltaproteobacteria bacterium]|nr:cytochrome P450 [Deltaproteobacteria bacterium]MBI3387756.1 cytochrome P450 [Deltaproteobacteria bacterium]